jgi:hypothetical protein
MNTTPQQRESYLLNRLNQLHPLVAAGVIFGLQVALFLAGVAIDLAVGGTASYGFLGGMGLFAGLILLDGVSLGMTTGRALLWTLAVTLGTVFGAVPYAYERLRMLQH